MNCLVCSNKDLTPVYSITTDTFTNKSVQYYQCAACELKFVYPQCWEELKEIYKQNFRKAINLKQHIIFRIPYSKRYKYTFNFLNGLKKGTLLDVGGGEGKFSWLMKLRGWDVLMVEPTKHYAEFAKKAYNFKVVNCFLEDFDSSKRFDLVTFSVILEHLPNQIESLRILRSYLKPEGRLFVVIPHNESQWYAATHLFLHSEKSIRAAFVAAGLKISKLERVGREFYILGESA